MYVGTATVTPSGAGAGPGGGRDGGNSRRSRNEHIWGSRGGGVGEGSGMW